MINSVQKGCDMVVHLHAVHGIRVVNVPGVAWAEGAEVTAVLNTIVLACEILFLVGFVGWVYTRDALQ